MRPAPMTIRVYNTLSRRKEDFVPLHGRRVSMFVCGITPYDATHIGHAKTYVAFDVVARYLRRKGYDVFYLQNVTDIEDRLIDRMHKSGRSWKDLVKEFVGEYLDGMTRLACTSVNLYAYATDYMPEILEQIEGLIGKGFAYATEDGSVYYDTTRYPDWGKLSGQKVEEHIAGARVAVDERKRNPADFALWKAQKPGEPAWDSPWGKGRPGWHIEDTAITVRHFGPRYDIHGGATELMFPHHEAEIAQAEAFTGVKPFVNVWMHGGPLIRAPPRDRPDDRRRAPPDARRGIRGRRPPRRDGDGARGVRRRDGGRLQHAGGDRGNLRVRAERQQGCRSRRGPRRARRGRDRVREVRRGPRPVRPRECGRRRRGGPDGPPRPPPRGRAEAEGLRDGGRNPREPRKARDRARRHPRRGALEERLTATRSTGNGGGGSIGLRRENGP